MRTKHNTVVSAAQHAHTPLPVQSADAALGTMEKESLYTLGYTLYQQGKYAEAIPFFTLLNLYEPSNATYYAALAACQKMTKVYEKAISNYAMALLLQPDQLEYVLHIAECQIAAQYPEGAIDTLKQLLAIGDESFMLTQALADKAQALLKLLTKH